MFSRDDRYLNPSSPLISNQNTNQNNNTHNAGTDSNPNIKPPQGTQFSRTKAPMMMIDGREVCQTYPDSPPKCRDGLGTGGSLWRTEYTYFSKLGPPIEHRSRRGMIQSKDDVIEQLSWLSFFIPWLSYCQRASSETEQAMLDFGWASIAARKPLRQQFSSNNGHPAKRKHGNIKTTKYNKTYIQNNI